MKSDKNRNNHFRCTVLAAVLLSIQAGFGQPQVTRLSPPLLDSLLQYNQGVQAAYTKFQSRAAEVPAHGALPDPQLEVSTSLSPLETRNGPVTNQVMLGQKFPLWGKLKRERSLATLQADIAWQDYRRTVVSTTFEMTKAWAEYVKLSRSLEILSHYLEDLEAFQNVALTHYSTGQGNTQHPVLKLQIEQSLIQSKANTLKGQLEAATHRLGALFNGHFQPADFSASWTEYSVDHTEQEWLDLARQVNPNLQTDRIREQIAILMQELNQRKNYPDLVAGMTWSLVGDTDLGGAVESGKDALGVKLGINLPLWLNRNAARVEAARINGKATQLASTESWNQVQATIQSQLQVLVEIEKNYQLYQKNLLPESRQMLASAYSAYETGKISFLDVLDSERMTFTVQLEFEAVKARRTVARAKLLKAVGLPLNGENHD
ncbi:MAG: TolC family protein [Lentisphaeria bacterium]|nr:TolC family protein [Candidatus Neomarinimicrobiota bacterium]MCF7843182.1 TolC family protein [Lentisphaeria bacterium]